MSLLSFGVFAAATPVAAQITSAAVDANRTLVTMVVKAEKAGLSAPRIADPQIARLFATAFDLRQVENLKGLGPGEVLDICQHSETLKIAYGHFGEHLKDGQPISSSVSPMNAKRFQDELTPLQVFDTVCMAQAIEPLTAFFKALPPAERTPTRLDGLRRARDGVFNMYFGALLGATDGSLSRVNSSAMIAQLSRTAERYAEVMPSSYRAKIVAMVDKLLKVNIFASKSDLLHIRAAMSRSDCSGLCAVS